MEKNTEKKITVSKFIDGYNKLTNPSLKENYIKTHIISNYAPLLMKKNILTIMCEKSAVDNGYKYIDMTVNKLNLYMAILALYTDIEIEKDENNNLLSWEAYDALKSANIMEHLLLLIGNDIEELLNVQKEVLDTWHMKNTSTEAYVYNLSEMAANKIGVIAGVGLEQLVDILSNENKFKKIMKIIEKYINTNK